MASKRTRNWLICGSITIICISAVAFGLAFGLSSDNSNNDPKPDIVPITLHLIPHSHQDPGWLQTYYYYYEFKVKRILTNVFITLDADPQRTFAYPILTFFVKWWDEQNQEMKDKATKIIKNGQFEFVSGGWVSNDEAVCHYDDIILQMKLGLDFLNKTFGIIPELAWSLDTFGKSKGESYLLNQMGYQYLMFPNSRIPENEFKVLKEEKNEIFMNRPFPDATYLKQNIFTQVYGRHYGGFRFSHTIENDLELLIEYVEQEVKSQNPKLRDFIFLQGNDFAYENAKGDYETIEQVMQLAKDKNVSFKIEYSTPTRYYQKLKDLFLHNQLSILSPDLIPNGNMPAEFWTGFYTSRPSLKGMIRETSIMFHQVSNLLTKFSLSKDADSAICNALAQNMKFSSELLSITQHHDAITGTQVQAVNADYIRMLISAKISILQVSEEIMNIYANNTGVATSFEGCLMLNETYTQCSFLKEIFDDKKNMIVGIYNPGSNGWKMIKIPVKNGHLDVSYLISGEMAEYDIICEPKSDNDSEFACYLHLSLEINRFDQLLLLFKYSENDNSIHYTIPDIPILKTKYQKLQYDKKNDNFELTKISEWSTNDLYEFSLRYMFYEDYGLQSSIGIDQNTLSGHYVFVPNERDPYPYAGDLKAYYLYNGTQIQQLSIVFENILVNIRIYEQNRQGFQIETYVKPIHIDTSHSCGKEIVMNIKPNFVNSKGIFYTDGNGLGGIKHEFRNSTEEFGTANVNYYPVTTSIWMKSSDNKFELSIVPDRPEGGTYLNENIQLLLHRRMLSMDGRGISEPLNLLNGVKVSHFILFRHILEEPSVRRQTELMLNQPPLSLFSEQLGIISDPTLNIKELEEDAPKQYTKNKLISYANIKISKKLKLNLFFEKINSIIIRIFNIEEPTNATSEEVVHFSLSDFAKNLNSNHSGNIAYEELNLSQQILISDMNKRKINWNLGDEIDESEQFQNNLRNENEKSILVNPMQFRTFRIIYLDQYIIYI